MPHFKSFFGLTFFLVFCSTFFTLIPIRAKGAVPQLINLQGVLRDGLGNPVPDGSYSVTFRIYNASAGGSILWSETKSIATSGGLFTTLLGSVTPVADTVFNDSSRWLGVTVSLDPEMTPRQKLSSVIYSKRVGSVDGALGGIITSDLFIGEPDAFLFSEADRAERVNTITTHCIPPAGGNLTVAHRATIGQGNSNLGDFAFIAGCQNSIPATGDFATISGGSHNFANALSTTVSGGENNIANNSYTTVSGGHFNTALGQGSTIGGGSDNHSEWYATVGGGTFDTAGGAWSTVSGGSENTAGADWSSIGGGRFNRALGHFSTVAGGGYDSASGYGATVSGGLGNAASGDSSTVGGGLRNRAGGHASTVSGGSNNRALSIGSTVSGGVSNEARIFFSTVGGGFHNVASSFYATVSGGAGDTANIEGATVGGGVLNRAIGPYSVISGGQNNKAGGTVIAYPTVGGGHNNDAGGTGSTIGGGEDNLAANNYSTVAGGSDNKAMQASSAVGGGSENDVGGEYSTIPGGFSNLVEGAYAFAAGRRARAEKDGSFVWADNSLDIYFPILSEQNFVPVDNNFLVRATGGVVFVSAVNSLGESTSGVRLAPGGGSWGALSDKNAKENFYPVDGTSLLTKLATLPISTWKYKAQDATIRHIGPMAQDFYAAFGVGEDDRHITTIDADGVAFAAIQELYKTTQVLNKKTAEIDGLKAQLSDLQELVQQLLADRAKEDDGYSLNSTR